MGHSSKEEIDEDYKDDSYSAIQDSKGKSVEEDFNLDEDNFGKWTKWDWKKKSLKEIGVSKFKMSPFCHLIHTFYSGLLV